MTHFAYPNVKFSAFIGCGRFTAKKNAPGNDYVLVEKLNTGNIAEIMDSAATLSPDSLSSPLNIYLKKDKPIEVHAGDSQNLAYLLTLINCSRKIKCNNKNIWCTGSIEQSMRLKQVDMSGFEIKLKAFLSPKNNDKLFIVPAANIQAYKHLCHEKDVQIILLHEIDNLINKSIDQKTIIAVHAAELQTLVDWLFLKKDTNSKLKYKLLYWGLFCFILIMILLSDKDDKTSKNDLINNEVKIICFYNFPDSYKNKIYSSLKKIKTIDKITSTNKKKDCYSFTSSVSLSDINQELQQQFKISSPNSYDSKLEDKEQLNIYFDAGFD
ncbi:hypothetical protein MHK_009577 [Candidatus Magnetomorum sp. HK-1]|nr:hypothetical protein MHK_009577 [Candidatus Magnetomorum sp. HK-1]